MSGRHRRTLHKYRVALETLAISFTPLCLCLSEETLKAVGPFYLVSMPVSNRTTHFRVLIQADTSGGRNGINIVSMISSVAHLLELIVRTFLLRAMGSNRVILTLEVEQQLYVLEEFRTIVSK